MFKFTAFALVIFIASANLNHHAKFIDTKTVLAEVKSFYSL